MRRSVEEILRRLWRGEGGAAEALLSAGLLPLELLYRGGVEARNLAYDLGLLRSHRVEIPVVSVGNVIVGGSGKTPVSAWIAGLLARSGLRPAVLSRGYGGDEVALHRGWNPGVPVHVSPDRVAAAERARREGSGVVVLDDGFQHRRLRRDLDVVLHPAERHGPRHLLPRGPLREPLEALGRADFVVLTRRTADETEAVRARHELEKAHPDLPVAQVLLGPAGWTDVPGGEREPPTGPLLAVTGIARPESFRRLVQRETGSEVEILAFPDHHVFDRKDFEEILRTAGSRTVVLTEKDAVRLGSGGTADAAGWAGAEHTGDTGDTAGAGATGRAGPAGLDRFRVLRLRVVPERGADELERRLLSTARSGRGEGGRIEREPREGPGSWKAGEAG